LLVYQPPDDLLFDVKIAFDIFIDKSIYYFKAHDNSENLEKERCEEIHDDIDFEKEEREIENGNYKERSDDQEDEEENEEEDEEDEEDGYGEEEQEKDEQEEEVSTTTTNIIHEPIVVKSKYTKPSTSVGVDDIQKLPLDWFQNVRQNYKKNQIMPRTKKPTIVEPTFRDLKKKI
jgi:hypothetical protein